MQVVQMPGLPPHPKLYFDAQELRAKISVRHPTWQSVERAIYIAEGVIAAITIVNAWLAWHYLPSTGDMIFQVMLWCFCIAVAYAAAKFLLRRPLREFLARQLFSTRTTFWFTPQAVVFRSRLYARPVLLWRFSGTTPLLLRFVAQPDVEAIAYAEGQSTKRQCPKEHLSQSRMLSVIIHGLDRRQELLSSYNGNSIRSLPVTEMGVYMAIRLPMVCQAAAALTASRCSERKSDAIDIDGGAKEQHV